jgi:hypothetical protein
MALPNPNLWYKFEDNLTDSGSGSNNGSEVGTNSYINGQTNRAFQTDAADSRITTAYAGVSGNQDWSCTFWCWLPNAGAGNKTLFAYGASGVQRRWIRFATANNLIDYSVYADGAASGNITIVEDQWNHIGFTYKGSTRKARLFLNGSFDNETTAGGDMVLSAVFAGLFGHAGGEYASADTAMDEFKIYESTLTDPQILEDYNLAFPPSSGFTGGGFTAKNVIIGG